ncbi:MAG: PDZ domain-containing protein [Planctomycetota bacterium]
MMMMRILGVVLASWGAVAMSQGEERPFMGVKGAPLSVQEADALGIPGGGRVDYVIPDCGAAAAGLRRGDILVEAMGKPILGFYDMVLLVRGQKIGDEVKMTVLRAGERKELTVTLRSYRDWNMMKGTPAPPIRVDEWVGDAQDLAALKGKVVVLVFWSIKSETWKLLEPDFQALAKDLEGKIQVVGIHVANDRFEEQTPDAVKAVLKEKPFGGPVGLASGLPFRNPSEGRGNPLIQTDYRFDQLPAIVVVDAEGKIAFKSSGADLYVSDVRKAVTDIVGK